MFSKTNFSNPHLFSSPPPSSSRLSTLKRSFEDLNPSPSSTHTYPDPSSSRKGKYTGCNCSKSQCLKMYCACFAVGRMCDQTCLCHSCKNCSDNMERSEAISDIIDRDPLAFSRPPGKVSSQSTCNCRKSACLKKYCECFKSGRQCGDECQCQGCKNRENQEQSSIGKAVKLIKLK